jgi:AmmeMemoRadiSam system protein A
MLSEQQGRTLIKLARQNIEEHLGTKPSVSVTQAELADPKLQEQRAVFVTLHKHGQLRGCIGALVGTESIIDGVRRHAINAAFHDHRFKPVTMVEVPELTIDISVLSEPSRLEFAGPADLVDKLRPHTDGVILRDMSGASATFLPQVWDQLPNREQFLSHLCLKAGLPEKAWQNIPLEVQTYQVQYFKE